MIQMLGQPRESYSADCQPMTNSILRRHVVTQSVGLFRATGLRPAVDSLVAAMAQIQREQPAIVLPLCSWIANGDFKSFMGHSDRLYTKWCT